MYYPTFLEHEAPLIQAYSKESVIAEKFEAMIDLGEQNSRMKDFYDVFNLLEAQGYEERLLKKAITETFLQRKTPYIENPPIFELSFTSKKEVQWNAFLKKNSLAYISLKHVLSSLKKYLQPIYEELRPSA